MFTTKTAHIPSLACLFLLAACPEAEPQPEDDAPGDAAVSEPDSGDPGRPDAGGTRSDAGTAHQDSGASPAQDAGTDPGPDADDPQPVRSARLFLHTPEPDNTSAPTVELDRAGNVHAVFPAYAGGGAYYAFCGAGSCDAAEDFEVVQFDTEGTVGNAMLALDADGHPRVLLSSYLSVYWGACDEACGERASWRFAKILDHGGDRAVSGEALALDPQGRPRFLIHTYRALFGIGQKPPETLLAQCDAECDQPASWRLDRIVKDEIWEGSHLRYDAAGGAHVATFVFSFGENAGGPLGAYLSCAGACNVEGAWNGMGFLPPYESMSEAVTMNPAISLALTKRGQPRVAMLGKTPEGEKRLAYFECDEDCQADNWRGGGVWDSGALNAGVDLALDADDRPRIAHTINYDIVLTYCDSARCTAEDSVWDSSYVERGSEIAPDQIFLEWNCTIGAWFLHNPSLAIDAAGQPRVGYQSRDVSGGTTRPDPTKPRCVAGTDMTWSRLALMSSHK